MLPWTEASHIPSSKRYWQLTLRPRHVCPQDWMLCVCGLEVSRCSTTKEWAQTSKGSLLGLEGAGCAGATLEIHTKTTSLFEKLMVMLDSATARGLKMTLMSSLEASSMLVFGRLFGQRLEEGGRKSGVAYLLLATSKPIPSISCNLLNLVPPTMLAPVCPFS